MVPLFVVHTTIRSWSYSECDSSIDDVSVEQSGTTWCRKSYMPICGKGWGCCYKGPSPLLQSSISFFIAECVTKIPEAYRARTSFPRIYTQTICDQGPGGFTASGLCFHGQTLKHSETELQQENKKTRKIKPTIPH